MLNLEKMGLKDFLGFGITRQPQQDNISASASTPDFYEVLGVLRSDSESKIKDRWIALANIYHPDKHGDVAKMAEINNAYNSIIKSRRL